MLCSLLSFLVPQPDLQLYWQDQNALFLHAASKRLQYVFDHACDATAALQVLESGDVEYGPSGLVSQRDHNVHSFLAALSQIKQVPSDCMFSIADLEAEHEERPQVANCLIFIRSIAQSQQYHAGSFLHSTPEQHPHQQQFSHVQQFGPRSTEPSNMRSSTDDFMVTPPPQRSSCAGRLQHAQQQQYGMVTPPSVGAPYGHNSPSTRLSFAGTTPGSAGSFGSMLQGGSTPSGQHRPLPAPLSSPLMDGHGSLSHNSMVPYRSSSSSLTPASMTGASIHAATHKSVQAAAGVTRLMQQCTHMLKERMFPHEQTAMQRHSAPGATPDTAMKALGPVLEGVLGQLTEEYERRLLTKDHELSKAQEAQRRAEDKYNRLQVSVYKAVAVHLNLLVT